MASEQRVVKEEWLFRLPAEKVLNNCRIRPSSAGVILQPRYHPGASKSVLSFAYVFISFKWQLPWENPRGDSTQSTQSFRNTGG